MYLLFSWITFPTALSFWIFQKKKVSEIRNIILMEEWEIGMFWGQVEFLFFFPDPHFEIP